MEDVVPPAIWLLGDERVEVLQLNEYVDEGAEAVDDAAEGEVKISVQGLNEIDTSIPTEEGADGYFITYTAVDTAGNSASVVREVVVLSRCPAPERWCFNFATCTVAGKCFPPEIADVFGAEVVNETPAAPPPDTTPPIITLLGECNLPSCIETITLNGEKLWRYRIQLGAEFEEPGASARDDVDGDLSESITVNYARGLVNTWTPTEFGDSYLITYSVSDASGNKAEAVHCSVDVQCPSGEFVCTEGLERNSYRCSSAGLCSVDLSALGSSLGGGPSPDEVVPAPVEMALRGPATVKVPQGSPYVECEPNTPPGRVCDRGATASNSIDGNLDAAIEVCSDFLEPGQGFTYQLNGIRSCQIDTSLPGTYTISFRVQDSSDPPNVASVSRTVVVEGTNDCTTLGELCDTEGLIDEVTFQDVPPVLTLLGSQFIQVKQGTEYAACKPGQESLSSKPCDPGAIAEDAEDGNLTSLVLALSGERRAQDCLLEDCLPERFIAKGLEGCGINTGADPGTVFDIQFVVFDQAGNWDAANRTVTITPPCDYGQFFCSGTCSEIDCSTRRFFISFSEEEEEVEEDTTPPVITLREGPGKGQDGEGTSNVLYMDYRTNLDWSVLPCLGGSGEEDCGATAYDAVDGDVSSSLSVKELVSCSPESQGCASCSPEALGAGYPWCLPGRYQYLYRASDSSGNKAEEITRSVCIGSRGRVDARVHLSLPDTSSDAAVAALAQKCLNPVSDINIALRSAAALAIPGCHAADSISVNKANAVKADGGGFGLDLEFRTSVTHPCGDSKMHCTNEESAVRRFKQSRRHLLQDEADDEPTTIQDSLKYTIDGMWSGFSSHIFANAMRAINMTFQEVFETSSAVETYDVDLIGGQLATLTGQVAAMSSRMLFDLELPIASLVADASDTFLANSDYTEDISWTGLWQVKVTEAMIAADAVLSRQAAIEAALDLDASASVVAEAALVSDSSLLSADLAERAAATQAQTYLAVNTEEFRSYLSKPCPMLSNIGLATKRQGTYEIYFSVGGGSASGGPGRRLSEANEAPGNWGGYQLQKPEPRDDPDGKRVLADRFIGPRPGANRVLGGLMLYHHRQGINLTDLCSQPREQRFIHLSRKCEMLRLLQHELDPASLEEYLMGIADSENPYGSDPVFIKQSSLYRPILRSRMGAYYNQSQGSPDFRNPFVPTGWYPFSTEGHEGGFPLVMEIGTNQDRAKKLWQAVSDGGYLDQYSKELEVEVMTFSPLSQLMGFSTTTFHWTPLWVGATTKCFAIVPVIDWNQNKLYYSTAVILASLAIIYTFKTVSSLWEYRCCTRQRKPKSTMAAMNRFNQALPGLTITGWDPVDILGIVFDVILSALMVAASTAGLMTALIASDFNPSPTYEVYDAQMSAPARFFLLDRQEQVIEEGLSGAEVTLPGGAGRWELPPNTQGLEDLSSDSVTMRSMRFWADLQNSLTALALLMVLVRLLHAWVFQARLSIAALSIVKTLPALASLAISSTIICALLAAWGHVLIGGFFGPFSTYTSGLGFLYGVLVIGDLAGATAGQALNEGMRPPGMEMHGLDSIMIPIFFVSVLLLLPIMINNFLVTIMLVMWDSTKDAVGSEALSLQEQLQQVLERNSKQARARRARVKKKASAVATKRLIASLLKGKLQRKNAMISKRFSILMDKGGRMDLISDVLQCLAEDNVPDMERNKSFKTSWNYLRKTVSGRFKAGSGKRVAHIQKSRSGKHWDVITGEEEGAEASKTVSNLNVAVDKVSRMNLHQVESLQSERSLEYQHLDIQPHVLAKTAVRRFGRMDDLIDKIQDMLEADEARDEERFRLQFVVESHREQLQGAIQRLRALISSCELLRQNQKSMRRTLEMLSSLNPEQGSLSESSSEEHLPNALSSPSSYKPKPPPPSHPSSADDLSIGSPIPTRRFRSSPQSSEPPPPPTIPDLFIEDHLPNSPYESSEVPRQASP